MTRQTDFERITRLVIDPMANYWGGKIPDTMLEAFVEDLAKYSDDTLTGAITALRRTSKWMPKLAQVIEACERIAPSQRGSGETAQNLLEQHRQRYEHARNIAAEFMASFEMTEEMQRATAEGWEGRLLDYARNAASLQGQLIAGDRNPGYSMMPLVHPLKLNEDKRRCQEFVASCRKQAARGVIEVVVPDYLIEEWKPKQLAA